MADAPVQSSEMPMMDDQMLAQLQERKAPRALIARHGEDSVLATAVNSDFKGKISVVVYAVAIPLAFVGTWLAGGLYVLVAILWLIPDRRIENLLAQ